MDPYLFQSLDRSEYESHFGEQECLSSQDCEELEAHGYQDHADGDYAEHHHRHHLVAATTSVFNCER